MSEVIINLNGKTEEEMKTNPIKTFIDWDELMPQIAHAIRIRDDESIEGLQITNKGIMVFIIRKRGRKNTSNLKLNL